MNDRTALLSVVIALLGSGCTLNLPFDPAGVLGSLPDPFGDLREAVEKGLADPLGSKPFPVLVGGDSERIFYATNLGDTRINFPGPTNDIVVPGFFGPSNLYVYQNNERRMIRPLVPAGLFSEVATDGRRLVYVASADETPLLPTQVIVEYLDTGGHGVLFDASDAGPDAYVGLPTVDGDRVVFMIGDGPDVEGARLRIVDLDDPDAAREIEIGFRSANALRGGLFAYELLAGDSSELLLLDLATDETTTLAAGLPPGTVIGSVFFTNNHLVWNERSTLDVSRVRAFDLASGGTQTWADAVAGQLTGATDTHFLTEEWVIGRNGITERTVLRLHEVGGRERKLADFRQAGLSGQSSILGDRVVFVNPERRIVIVPIAGGERRSFRPF